MASFWSIVGSLLTSSSSFWVSFWHLFSGFGFLVASLGVHLGTLLPFDILFIVLGTLLASFWWFWVPLWHHSVSILGHSLVGILRAALGTPFGTLIVALGFLLWYYLVSFEHCKGVILPPSLLVPFWCIFGLFRFDFGTFYIVLGSS